MSFVLGPKFWQLFSYKNSGMGPGIPPAVASHRPAGRWVRQGRLGSLCWGPEWGEGVSREVRVQFP